MTWPAARILGESAAWVSPWFPPGASRVNRDWLEFYVLDGAATVMRAVPRGQDPAQLVDDVLAELRGHDVTTATWATHPGHAPGGVDEVLLGLGAKAGHTVDICARPPDPPPDMGLIPDAVSVRPVRSRADMAGFAQVSAAAWDYPAPTPGDIDQAYADLVPGSFTGYWDHIPAGAAGCTLAGEVARLWGAGVIPAFRGRGVYRALVAARLAEAASRGATLALVHAAPPSTAILQRLGFGVYGHQRVFTFRPAALAG
jgi:GNAT superfamily N-acetyltransferase